MEFLHFFLCLLTWCGYPHKDVIIRIFLLSATKNNKTVSCHLIHHEMKWVKGKVKFQQDSSHRVEALLRVKIITGLNIKHFHVIIWSDHEMIELILHFNNNYFVLLPSFCFHPSHYEEREANNIRNKVFMFWLWERRGSTTALRNNCNGIDHNCRIQWDHICNYKLQLSHKLWFVLTKL